MRRRPIKIDSDVWCDVHCGIHPAEPDYFQEGVAECLRRNWRPVYVLGEPGEEF
jgi:hypothetical protein